MGRSAPHESGKIPTRILTDLPRRKTDRAWQAYKALSKLTLLPIGEAFLQQ
ncbi:MAG: hypothetical protein QNJ32_24355 [Xenococcaceae cyanobacterium MO_167.B27]|nr:hypothetical protein [Xenococcaceae cyanobacterium MO_167.B27]